MAATATPRRQAHRSWGRLKNVRVDPLESIGLPSKGDNRHGDPILLDFKLQESYFKDIVQRHRRLCGPDTWSDDLENAFASLSLDGASDSGTALPMIAPSVGFVKLKPVDVDRESSVVLQAMRKIREGLVASARVDNFARHVYVFIIRATILAKHVESYHPALLHLLYRIHPMNALPTSELQEFLGFYILDLACRQADLGTAFAVRYRYMYSDLKVDMLLKARVHGNWWVFRNIGEELDQYQRRLLEWANNRMRKHAIECLSKSYLKADIAFIEKVVHGTWEELRKENVAWEKDGDIVTIRQIQRK